MSDFTEDSEALPAARLAQVNRLATAARMIAALAHELNNSLQVVSGLVELLNDHPELPPDAAARIKKIGIQSDKATAAIRQVLGYTRETQPDQQGAELSAVVERALALRRYNLGRAGITVTSEVPGGIRVQGDEKTLLQIVLNLVLNAEDALAGHPRRDLRIAGTTRDGRVQLQVSDSGPGIPAEIQDRIFEPFFSTRNDPRAVGLGLAVARRMAADLKGTVALASGGAGETTFVVDLPAA